MCGIFGYITKTSSSNNFKIIEDLAILSQVRGKDSSGFAVRLASEQSVNVLRGPLSVDGLLKTKDYKKYQREISSETSLPGDTFAILGHARLVTNGTQLEDNNNQPVVKDGIVGVHNGIIVNDDELWKKFPTLQREYEIDTEALFAVIRHHLNNTGSIVEALKMTDADIFGTASVAILLNDRDEFVTYTNNGSLYILSNFKDLFIVGSEKNILHQLLARHRGIFNESFKLMQVPANNGYGIRLSDFTINAFDLASPPPVIAQGTIRTPFKISVQNIKSNGKQQHVIVDIAKYATSAGSSAERLLLQNNIDRISLLKRCTICLLPETFPFIKYDEKGVCNICAGYKKKNQPKPIEELIELVQPFKRTDGQPDCLVPFSGGRDSTYSLHLVKNILKMNPIAFTYDWGIVTDLGRRNIARVTGKLGVENIIVSADIRRKRTNIRKNILAWLKNPELGMVPLFMAGDKYFFYYADKVKKQNTIKLNIWGINPLENTDFKVGFCGLPLRFDKKRIYSISLMDQIKLFSYVGGNLVKSPGYMNKSVFDSLGSFASRYLAKKEDYYHMFDYYRWDEAEIEDLIINEYKWETAIDTKTTWRIGDGTAAFYNYIYYTVAGFSEFDTFRSNQIREGMMTRERAMKLVNEENRPRYESLKWYLEIVGLDYESVIKRINRIPKLY